MIRLNLNKATLLKAAPFAAAAGIVASIVTVSLLTQTPATTSDVSPASTQQVFGDPVNAVVGRTEFERDGLKVSLVVDSPLSTSGILASDDIARVSLTITDAASGEPVTGLYPAAWIDPISPGVEITDTQCRDKAGLYLRGLVGIRPMVDLNSYYIVVLNEDPSIAVIDPIIGIRGITKLLTQIALPGRASDWVRSADQKKIFVSIPSRDAIAVIDLDTFQLSKVVRVGTEPTRVAIQSDGRYLWVGHGGAKSGVTVVDTGSLEVVAEIATGRGHHEIQASADDKHVFVTNRDDSTVSVISVKDLKRTRTLRFDGTPIGLATSELSGAVYVTDGPKGEIVAYDANSLEERARIKTQPGIGPVKVSQDGRWGITVNTSADKVVIFDTSDNRVANEITVYGKPFHIATSRNFAYIRALDTADVSMIQLDTLGGELQPAVLSFPAGVKPPSESSTLLPSNLFAGAVKEAAMLVVSPSDAAVYYYMEGMNAPMGNFQNYGHRPLSALITDRTIKEIAPGQYESRLKVPAAGDFQFIMTMDQPDVIECFRFRAERNKLATARDMMADVTYMTRPGTKIAAGKEVAVRFSIADPDSGAAKEYKGVRVTTFRAPGQDRREVAAHHVGKGIYEVKFTPAEDGVYYVYPSVQQLGLAAGRLNFLTLVATDGSEAG